MRECWKTVGWVGLLFAAGGCSWFDDSSPETVRVLLEGQGSGFQVVTSTEFVAATNEVGRLAVQVFDADTAAVSLPFERTWNIAEDQRFFFEGMPADSSATITVRVRVFLDDSEAYDRMVLTRINDPARFVYLFNQQILQDFELL